MISLITKLSQQSPTDTYYYPHLRCLNSKLNTKNKVRKLYYFVKIY